MPNVQPPWAAFHKDAYLAFVLVLVSSGVFVPAWRGRVESRCDWLSLYFVGLALLVMVQWTTGKLELLGQAFVGAAYFLAAGFALYLGRLWTAWSPGNVERLLFGAFVVAGIFSAGIIYGQWAQIDMHPVWFNSVPPGGRPFGNLNQPNNAGSLLLLCLISMAWLLTIRQLRPSIFFLASIFLIGALVLTESRINFISFLGLLGGASILAWRLPNIRCYRWFPVLLLFIFLIITAFQYFGGGGSAGNASSLQRDLTGVRMAAYTAFGEAVFHGPLSGFGFDQGARAQIFAGSIGHQLPGLFGSAHNFILDVAVWFGWPVALMGLLLGGMSIYQIRRLKFDEVTVAAIACVLVLLMHGMVELPLAYAYFLLPLCLLVGALSGRGQGPAIRISFLSAGIWLVGLSLALAVLWIDYLRVEASFTAWRFKIARVGKIPEKIDVNFLVLDQFSVLIEGLDVDSSNGRRLDLAKFRAAVLSFPSPYALQKLVLLYAKRGDVDSAREGIEMAGFLTSKETSRDLAAQWRALQKTDLDLSRVEWNVGEIGGS